MENNFAVYSKYNQFKCSGGSCEDNCCHSWDINIDAESLERYKNMPDIIKNVDLDNKKFKLREDNYCKMLDDNGWCNIHKNYGEDCLCYTCKTYPRKIFIRNGIINETLDLSCIEASRLVLLDEEIAYFLYEYGNCIDTDKPNGVTKALVSCDISFDIMRVCVSILENKKRRLWDKLYYINMLVTDIQKYIDANSDNINEDYLYKLFDTYIGNLENNELWQVIEMSKVEAISPEYFESLYDEFVYTDVTDKNNLKTKNSNIINKLKNSKNKSHQDVVDVNYKFVEFVNRHEYIVINYILFEMFNTSFPDNYDKVDKAYGVVLIKVMLLQIATVMLQGNEEITENDLVESTYYLYKTFNHSLLAIDEFGKITDNQYLKADVLLKMLL